EGVRQETVPPDTGTLRGDLLRLGDMICAQGRRHASTMRAVLSEMSRNPALSEALQREFIDDREALMKLVLQQAIDRGEIDAAAVSDEVWDVLPGYLVFRFIISGRPPTRHTVRALVDEVVMPSLTRTIS